MTKATKGKKKHASGAFKDIPSFLVDLTNSVKQGMVSGMLVAASLHLGISRTSSSPNFYLHRSQMFSHAAKFRKFVVFSFTRNAEERIPLYYACLTGNADVLRFLMSLYIVHSVSRREALSPLERSKISLQHKMTFQSWSKLWGFWPGLYNRTDLEVSYISALNSEIRDLLYRTPISIRMAISTLMQFSNPSYKQRQNRNDKYSNSNLFTNRVMAMNLIIDSHCTHVAAELGVEEMKRKSNANVKKSKPKLNLDVADTFADYTNMEPEYEDDDDVPSGPAPVARESSAELGKVLFYRAVSDSRSAVPQSDGEEEDSFELVSDGDGDWEMVEDESKKPMSYAMALSSGATRGVEKSRDDPDVRAVVKVVSPSSVSIPFHPPQASLNDDTYDPNEVRDALKSQRSGKLSRGRNDRHRGKGIWGVSIPKEKVKTHDYNYIRHHKKYFHTS